MDKNKQIPHGEKTIKICISLYTNGLEGIYGDKINVALNEGTVRMITNRSRGIRGQTGEQFDGFDNMQKKIAKILKSAGILVVDKKDKRKIIL
tara:strand:+ start:331 stop:609 length:279 start_codon:yes stop_codon:yes gene_type:complete